MKRTIPSSIVITCDRCKTVCTHSNRAQHGELHVKRDALDMSGQACANADVNMDLCDRCLQIVITAINTAADPV